MRYRQVFVALLGSMVAFGCAAGGKTQPEPSCERPSTDMKLLGEPLTVAEVESSSLEEMKATPTAPQVPFGYQNDKWESLKVKMLAGDKLYKYTATEQGGYVLIRNGCIVVRLMEWIV